MKNLMKVICFILSFAMIQSAIAQTVIGVRAGTNLATYNEAYDFYSSLDMDKTFMPGVDIAVFTKFNVAGNFSIQPEFHWMQKGVLYTGTLLDNSETSVKFRTDYLELPVLARFDIGTGNLTFNVFAGPSAGWALSSKYVGENVFVGSEGPNDYGDVKEDIEWDKEYGIDGTKSKRFDISAVAGMGVELDVGVGRILFDARYNHDFNDFVSYEVKPDNPERYFNRGVSFTAGFAIPLGL